MRNTAAALAVLGALALAPGVAAADDCVFIRSISGFNVIDDETLVIHTSGRTAYRVNLVGHCQGLRWSETIAIDSRDGRLCWPSNSHIITEDHGMRSRCLVDSVLRMAPEDVDKLKAEKKAKESGEAAPQ